MAKTFLNKLSTESLLIGSTYSLINSFELFNDGILLLKNGRLSRAYTLFQLGMEEAGKTILLLDAFYIQKVQENFKEVGYKFDIEKKQSDLSKVFCDHPEKMKYIFEFEIKSIDDFNKY